MNRKKIESGLKELEELNLSSILEVIDRNTKQKKPRKQSAYNAFVSDNFRNLKDVPSKEKIKVIANMWKSMSDTERNEYKKLHEKYMNNL